MTAAANAPVRRWGVWLLVAAGMLLFAVANWHLVYVAILSQPDCVPHARQVASAQSGDFRAAVSSCSGK